MLGLVLFGLEPIIGGGGGGTTCKCECEQRIACFDQKALCGRSAKAAGGSVRWRLEVKELHDEVLETSGGVHQRRPCGHCGERYLLYSSYKSFETSAVVSGCCVVHERVVSICRDHFTLGSGDKHGLGIGRHDRRQSEASGGAELVDGIGMVDGATVVGSRVCECERVSRRKPVRASGR
jgi:hypothetical protein